MLLIILQLVMIVWLNMITGEKGQSLTCMPHSEAEAWIREVVPKYPMLRHWIAPCEQKENT